MALTHHTDIDLPAHRGPGGFDHAAVHRASARLYVAHTANDGLDVVDCASNSHIGSIPHLEGVAGALVSEEHDLVVHLVIGDTRTVHRRLQGRPSSSSS